MSLNNMSYYAEQQCSPQWRAFLTAFATEFSSKGDTRELRAFMYQLGHTMGAGFKLVADGSLQELEACMNGIWAQLNWGWTELLEEKDSLLVAHHASPLKVAFGTNALSWAPALLEGVYAQWFESLGMDKSLRLTQNGDAQEDGQLFVFQLKKQADEPAYFNRR